MKGAGSAWTMWREWGRTDGRPERVRIARPKSRFAVLEAILKRCHPREAPENHPKVALIAESDFKANLHNGLVGRSEQVLRQGNAEAIQIGHKRLAGHFFEQMHEAAVAHRAK